MQSQKELDYDTPSPLAPGLKVVHLSERLLTYSSSDGDDLLTRGVIYFDSSELFFEKAEFVLPRAEADLLDFLLQRVISTMNLN
jgi:hypothetical protein